MGAEEVVGWPKVRTVACGYEHTLMVTEAGELWACGNGAQGRLGLNDGQDRLVPTRLDPLHLAHAPISAVAAGDYHSAAVTAGGASTTGAKVRQVALGTRCSVALGHADLDNKLVPTLVLRQLLGGARVGRCHGLLEDLAHGLRHGDV